MELVPSSANVVLLDRAGCRKGGVMRRLRSETIGRWGREKVALSAFSGCAALVVGGQPLHYLLGMDKRPPSRDGRLAQILARPQVCTRLNGVRVLFIDEVRILSSSLFVRLGYVMRRVAPPHLQHLPFGGCQIIGKHSCFSFLRVDTISSVSYFSLLWD